MPVILAAQKAEIRMIVVQNPAQAVVLKTLSRKFPTQKRAGGVAQEVEYLPSSKREALSSNLQKKKTTHRWLTLVILKSGGSRFKASPSK
jgi:hypothetical protein